MPGEGSFLARCALKFSEVLAAGVATGLSGYVVAHLAGYVAGPIFSVSQPPAAQDQVRPAANVGDATTPPPQAAPPNDAAPHRSSKSEAKLVQPTALAPVRTKVSTTRSKPVESRTAETVRGRATTGRPQDAAGRPDTAESLEARVRAALARSNGRAADVPPHQLQAPSAVSRAGPIEARSPAAAVAAEPAEEPPGPFGSAPRAAALPPRRIDAVAPPDAAAPPIPPNLAPLATQIAGQNSGGQNSALQLPPLGIVVVKSQPSVGADSPQPSPAPAADALGSQSPGNGPFSAFARMLRSDQPLPEDQAPRPPVAVGQ